MSWGSLTQYHNLRHTASLEESLSRKVLLILFFAIRQLFYDFGKALDLNSDLCNEGLGLNDFSSLFAFLLAKEGPPADWGHFSFNGWQRGFGSPIIHSLAEPVDSEVCFTPPAKKEQVAVDFSHSGGSYLSGIT